MRETLAELGRRHDELTARMSDPELYASPEQFRKVAREAAELEPIVTTARRLEVVDRELGEARELLGESDPEMRALAEAELLRLGEEAQILRERLKLLLLPKDPDDGKDVVLEIRAGTGGEEASLFAADLYRMYSRYAEARGWQMEQLSASYSESGGFKEVIALVSGDAIFSRLKFEAGVHRVQRVPVTESQGRIHTSACTVAVLPEAEDIELHIPESDLDIQTMRAQGAGGQHVNVTDSAVRIIHRPTGLAVVCQDERSQHKNKAKAMQVLRARLYDRMQAEAHAERAGARRLMVGSGDRSERIRTYNFPQNRVTDHRIGLTLYRLDEIIQGALDPVIEPVITAHQAELLNQRAD
ncbi:MAG: peptide chain release factor 1 [Myxococcales bacterium]|nr:peptide chain release factor 1 [Myxococcales bacterium]